MYTCASLLAAIAAQQKASGKARSQHALGFVSILLLLALAVLLFVLAAGRVA